MSRRDEWRKVLEVEIAKWSAKSCEELTAELVDVAAYEVEVDSKTFQVEIEIVEKTDAYVQVMVAVDDGSLPSSILPVTQSFVRNKAVPQ
jgi:hypothetical protein